MSALKNWWADLSKRERMLVGVMGVLVFVVFLWLAIARPVEAGLANARERQAQAQDRNASIRAKVKTLKALPTQQAVAAVGSLDQMVGQSAGEAGFTLERAQAQGEDRVELAIASARPTALFGWISALEAQGIVVETLTVQPAPTAGTISVRAVLKRAGQ